MGYRRNRLEQFGERLGMGPAVTLMVAINVVVFVLEMLSNTAPPNRGIDSPLMDWFAFHPYRAFNKLELWRFVTYMFLHGSFWHIALNMFVLWMFGTRIEGIWGQRIFLIYYFVCGVGGAVTYGLFSVFGFQDGGWMVGASGAIYGLLLAFGVSFPDAVIMIFFILPMRAKYAVIVFGFIELLSVRSGGQIAHLAHLGGMLFGWLFILGTTGGRLGRIPRVPHIRFGGESGKRPATGPMGGGSGGGGLMDTVRRWRARRRFRVVEDDRKDRGGNGGMSGGDRKRIDEILEKISKEGLQSLTPEEQEILRRASRKD